MNNAERGGEVSSLEARKNQFQQVLRAASIQEFVALGMSEKEAEATVDDIRAASEMGKRTGKEVTIPSAFKRFQCPFP